MAPFHSTRSDAASCDAKEAVRRGIAPDGGLYVADDLPKDLFDLDGLRDMAYRDVSARVVSALLPGFSADEVGACVDAADTGTFDDPQVTAVRPLGPDFALELFHGPTSAFKDVALQMLPQLMARTGDVAREQGAAGRVMVVTATSGDTGKAALAGFADAPSCGIAVFYPAGKVSDVQRLQMVTQRGANVAVCAVRGNFADAQSAVKRTFADEGLASRLAKNDVSLTSANSINVGRLVPQVAYYFAAYAQLARAGAIVPGDEVEFCVPTGNFGDVLAGYYAKRLGLPVSRLVVASNENNVLTDFLSTGVYDRRRPFHQTISPSMDILISSNLERMLYHLSDGDCELVAHLMGQLADEGAYRVPAGLLEHVQEVFACGCATDDDARAAIARAWNEHGYLMDPHSACGYHVMGSLGDDGRARARVLLCTASPYKFPSAVCRALGLYAPPDGFACMRVLEKHTRTAAPRQLAKLEGAEVRFSDEIAPDEIPAYVERAAGRIFGERA